MVEYKCPYPDDCWYCREILTVLMNQPNKWNKQYGMNEIAKIMVKKMSRLTALKHTRHLIHSGYLMDEDRESRDDLMNILKSLFYDRDGIGKLKKGIKKMDKDEREETLNEIYKIIYGKYGQEKHIGKKAQIRLYTA